MQSGAQWSWAFGKALVGPAVLGDSVQGKRDWSVEWRLSVWREGVIKESYEGAEHLSWNWWWKESRLGRKEVKRVSRLGLSPQQESFCDLASRLEFKISNREHFSEIMRPMWWHKWAVQGQQRWGPPTAPCPDCVHHPSQLPVCLRLLTCFLLFPQMA